MLPGRLRIADLLKVVMAAAFGASYFRNTDAFQRADLTRLVAPLVSTTILVVLVATAIAAGVGRADRRASRWGFMLGCGVYLALTSDFAFDYRWLPVSSNLMREGFGWAGLRANALGWTWASDFVMYMGFMPNTLVFS